MMIKCFTKLIFVNSNYYLRTKGRFDKVLGKPIKVANMDFFLYKNKINFWCIVEGLTGRRITKFYKSPTTCLAQLNEQIGFKTSAQVENAIHRLLKKLPLSPRYRYIANPTRCGI